MPEKTHAELLSRVLAEVADNTGHLMTVLDLQARILARLEDRPVDDVVDEVSALLKERRREALRALDAWAHGASSLFEDDA